MGVRPLSENVMVQELQQKLLQQQQLISKLLKRNCTNCGVQFTYNDVRTYESDESEDDDIILDATLIENNPTKAVENLDSTINKNNSPVPDDV